MTERDAAWAARLIARFSTGDIVRIVRHGRWRDPNDAVYLASILVERQRRILRRYLARLSPLGDVRTQGDRICATDYARLRGVWPAATFRYTVVAHGANKTQMIPAEVSGDGEVCFAPRAAGRTTTGDPARIVVFEVRDGSPAGPLRVHTYDLGERALMVVGLERPEP
jgi:hypothetical protein